MHVHFEIHPGEVSLAIRILLSGRWTPHADGSSGHRFHGRGRVLATRIPLAPPVYPPP